MSLPNRGDKPNRPRSIDDLEIDQSKEETTERDMTPSQMNVRIPTYLHKALQRHKIEHDENMEDVVTRALREYLDI